MLASGIFGAVAALAALYERTQTGKGRWIDVSGQECVAFALEDAVAEWSINARVRRRHGDTAREAGTGVYPCKDGHVSVVAGRLGTARGVRRADRVDRLIGRARARNCCASRNGRISKYRQSPDGIARFAEIFGAFCRTRGKQELYREGQARQIAIAPVNTIADVVAGRAARGQFVFPAAVRHRLGQGCRVSRAALSSEPHARAPRAARRRGSASTIAKSLRDELGLVITRGTEVGARPGLNAMQLAGLRVLDFCWIGAGAFVTRILADLGAEVIKVESRSHPDNLRLSGPHQPGAQPLESSGYFASRNTSKKSIALNMSHPQARQIALRLADAMLDRQQQFSSRRHGEVGPRLRARSQRSIRPSSISPCRCRGASGPHRDYIGFGSTIAALCGLVDMAGLPGRAPIGTGTHYPDHVPNPGHALVAVLAAAFHRARTGEGQHIELAQIESTVNVLGPVHSGLVRDRRAAADRRQPPRRRGAARRLSLRRMRTPGARSR